MDAQLDDTQLDKDGHGHFRDLCLVYGDFHRPVFLETIREWFIRSADDKELAELRKALATRVAALKTHRGKRGRPRAEKQKAWIIKARVTAWRRVVEGWTWRKIAESEGTRISQSNLRTVERTLSRRLDQYAAIIWDVCREVGIQQPNDERLKRYVEAPMFRRLLWIRTGLPFREYPGQCKQIVLELIPRGPGAATRELLRAWRYIDSKGKNQIVK